ncbi:alpha/beta hydrolase [Ectobacillus funiculus]
MKQQGQFPLPPFSIYGITVHYELYNYEPNSNKNNVRINSWLFLSSTFSYRRLIPLLAQHGAVVALDLPPFGKSDKSKDFTYSYRNMANIVVSLVEHLHLSNIILVGHSMGGQIALYISKQRPDLVDKNSTHLQLGIFTKNHTFPLSTPRTCHFFICTLKKLACAKRRTEKNLLNVIHDRSLIDDEMMQGYAAPFFDERIFHALTRMIRDREGDLPSCELQQIEIPSLLIWGEEDKVVPISVGKTPA